MHEQTLVKACTMNRISLSNHHAVSKTLCFLAYIPASQLVKAKLAKHKEADYIRQDYTNGALLIS